MADGVAPSATPSRGYSLTPEKLEEVTRVVPNDDIRALSILGWKRTECNLDSSRLEHSDGRVEIGHDDSCLEDAMHEWRSGDGGSGLRKGDGLLQLDEFYYQSAPFEYDGRRPFYLGRPHYDFQSQLLHVPFRTRVPVGDREREESARAPESRDDAGAVLGMRRERQRDEQDKAPELEGSGHGYGVLPGAERSKRPISLNFHRDDLALPARKIVLSRQRTPQAWWK